MFLYSNVGTLAFQPNHFWEFEHNIYAEISWPKVPFQQGGWGVSVANILLTEDDNVFFRRAFEYSSRLARRCYFIGLFRY